LKSVVIRVKMLNTSNNTARRLDVTMTYEGEVCRRTGRKFWSFPNHWNRHVVKVVLNAKRCNADVAEFVKAQFQYLDRQTCQKFFNMTYPPITAFLGERARVRLRKYQLLIESYNEPEEDRVARVGARIRKDLTMLHQTGSITVERLFLSYNSGQISIHTLAYLHCTFIQDEIEEVVLMASRLDLGESDTKFKAAREFIIKMNLHRKEFVNGDTKKEKVN